MGLSARVEVQRRLQRDGDAVGHRIMAAVERSIPTYASLPEPQRQETRAIAGWAVRRLLEMWVDGTRFTDADRRRFHGIGVARATDGRPLLAVLRAYRVAAVETAELIVAAGGTSLDVDDVVDLNRVLLTSIEDLSDSLFNGYTLTVERLTADRAHSLGGLTHDLLSGRHVSRDALRDRATQLGLTVPDRLSVLVATPATGAASLTDGDVADLASVVEEQLAGGADVDVVLHARRDGAAVVLAPRSPRVAEELRFRGWRGCLVGDVRTDDVPRAYRLALNAVRAAPPEALASRTPLELADALHLALLVGEPGVTAAELAAVALGPLLEPRHAHLLEGLRAFLDHGSATEAAAALGLHPQTMRHRLRRATEISGRDATASWDRLLLHTSVVALHARTPPSGAS